MPRSARLALAAALAAAALACGPQQPGAATDPEAAKEAARVAGETITVGELDEAVRRHLFEQATQGGGAAKVYELRSQVLDEIIDERLLEAEAKARGTSVEQMLAGEEGKAAPTSDAEVQKIYDDAKPQLPKDSKLETFAAQIRTHLETQARAQARAAFLASLREKAKVTVALEPPRVQVAATGPSLGPANAPVTIVEFSDYECPFCKRAHPTLTELVKKYPEQVRFVYRHFPLDNIHRNARGAAEASQCADEQGKFWAYHELIFAATTPLTAETLRGIAEKAGLDLAKYDACAKERRHRAHVDSDVADGRAAGVSGTPAFYVNGIPLSGARSLEDFEKVIQSELARRPAGES